MPDGSDQTSQTILALGINLLMTPTLYTRQSLPLSPTFCVLFFLSSVGFFVCTCA